MDAKARYKIRNWSAYNKSLVKRGDLTVWIDEDAIRAWKAKPTLQVGRPFTYSNNAILLALTLRSIFHLPLRAAQGFLGSMFKLMSVTLPVPDYTTLSRRADGLEVNLETRCSETPLHLVIDSTGLKVYGEGEWKVRTHGADKRRVWRKFHIGIDAHSMEIVATALTTSGIHDSTLTENLIPTNRPLSTVYADGAYDNHNAYDPIAKRGARALIPPRSGAAHSTKHTKVTIGTKLRDANVKKCWKVGKKQWKKDSGYHRRSLVETTMFRIKTIFGDKLRSRNIPQQTTESRIKSRTLNKFTHLGMPESVRVL